MRTIGNIYPPIYYVFIVANLISIYFKGTILLSWWWALGLFVMDMIMVTVISKFYDSHEKFYNPDGSLKKIR